MKNFSKVSKYILATAVLFQIYLLSFAKTDAANLRIFHGCFLITLSFLMSDKLKQPWKITLAVLTIVFFGIYFFKYKSVVKLFGLTGPYENFVALVILILLFVAGYLSAPSILILALIFIAYTFFGKYIPGILGHNGYSIRRVLNYMVWGTQGIFGVGISASSSYIFLFVILGSFLKHSGFSDFINTTALYFVRKSYGGAGKVSVISSLLLGMINGSAVANVATTGTITIPMMKKSGFTPEFSGAVEAAASTGGQFTPPVMGAAGFIMAELLGIPYSKVMIAAAVPAALYYFGIYKSVDLEAKKNNMLSNFEITEAEFKTNLKEKGILFLPLPVIIVLLLMGYTPIFSAIIAIGVAIVSTYFTKDKMGFDDIVTALCEGATSMVVVGLSCMIIGIIIGTVSLTGIGLLLGNFIINLLGTDHLLLTGVLVMLVSVVLGMGVPGVAAYVVVSSVAVPILIKSGANPVASHMFCLIYACLANITPPVAISSYVASSIASSNMRETSLIAVKIALAGFVIPFFFLINPEIIELNVLTPVLIWKIITMFFGTFLITAGTIRYYRGKLNSVYSLLLLILGLLSIDPGLVTDIISILGFAIIYLVRKNEKVF